MKFILYIIGGVLYFIFVLFVARFCGINSRLERLEDLEKNNERSDSDKKTNC